MKVEVSVSKFFGKEATNLTVRISEKMKTSGLEGNFKIVVENNGEFKCEKTIPSENGQFVRTYNWFKNAGEDFQRYAKTIFEPADTPSPIDNSASYGEEGLAFYRDMSDEDRTIMCVVERCVLNSMPSGCLIKGTRGLARS